MAIGGGITFAEAAAELSRVTDNGVCEDDPRVMSRVNEATKALLDKGIWVGCMATYDVVAIESPANPLAPGTQLWLPTALENAIEVEVVTPGQVRSRDDVKQGWYDLVNDRVFVDPAFAHDNPLVDLFLYPDTAHVLRRVYDYPGLTPGATVRVTGAKRYLPITDPAEYLIIQNVRALKLMILSIERSENNAIDDAAKYEQQAIALLQAEVKKHQLDPRNTMKRKANYQADLVESGTGSMGQVRARLALDLPGFLLRGKSEITYLINRALEALVRRENLLRIASKWDIHDSATEIQFTLPIEDAGTILTEACPGSLAAGDYDIIKRMVQFFVHADNPITDVSPTSANAGVNQAQISTQMETEVYALLEARLAEALEFKRRTTYETVLANASPTTIDYFVARLALELPDGLKRSNAELFRLVNSCEQRLMERGCWKGTVTECVSTIHGGYVLFPRSVEAIRAASLDGSPVRIRSRYFEFHENAVGEFCADENCARLLLDEGEEYLAASGAARRKYKVLASCCESSTLRAIVKLRFIPKVAGDTMVLQNYEAIRLVAMSILNESDPAKGPSFFAQALDILQKELKEHVAGIMPHVQVMTRGMRRIRMLR